jgi:hypothetical protein
MERRWFVLRDHLLLWYPTDEAATAGEADAANTAALATVDLWLADKVNPVATAAGQFSLSGDAALAGAGGPITMEAETREDALKWIVEMQTRQKANPTREAAVGGEGGLGQRRGSVLLKVELEDKEKGKVAALEGFLHMKFGAAGTAWHKRYFVCSSHHLLYSNRGGEAKEGGEELDEYQLDLFQGSAVELGGEGGTTGVEVVLKDGARCSLRAGTVESAELWAETLQVTTRRDRGRPGGARGGGGSRGSVGDG